VFLTYQKHFFDKVNHHALFIKLMKRNIPVILLTVLENWFYAV